MSLPKTVTCPECGERGEKKKIAVKRQAHRYVECGLPNVLLENVPKAACDCGWWRVWIPAMTQLHGLLSEMVAFQETRLTPREIRFLRTCLGMGKDDLARLLKVSEDTVRRWEAGSKDMPDFKEKYLRHMVLLQRPRSEKPVSMDRLEAMASVDEQVPVEAILEMRKDHWRTAA